MKAIKIATPGRFDRFALVDLDDPGEPGIGAIRVRLHASSLNFHDYLVVSGKSEVADGRIPMSDGAGIVEAVGKGISEFGPGDQGVSTQPTWLPSLARGAKVFLGVILYQRTLRVTYWGDFLKGGLYG